jgi:serine/threonine-protein kinase
VVGSYVIEQQVGQGGMAVVYEARHRTLGKRVAIKMLLPHHAARADLAARFQREGEAAALLDHPHAAAVFDGGNDARGTPYLVLEYLAGEHLGTLLLRAGSLTVVETVDLLLPVMAAIAVAHDLGIVHRDLKPENVFLAQRRGQVVPKVLDFGISKTSKADSLKLTRAETLLGTPHYMSPEQAQGANQADARSDQFALGVILYECVTGQCPFEGSSLFAVLAAIVGGTLTSPSRLVQALDPSFDSIVTRALSKDPDERFVDVRALGAALLPLASARVQLCYAHEFSPQLAFEMRPLGLSDSERPSAPELLSDHRITVVALYRHAAESTHETSGELPASLELLTLGVSRRPLGVASVLLGSSLVLAALTSVALAGSEDSSSKSAQPTPTTEPLTNSPSEVVVPPADLSEQGPDAKRTAGADILVNAASATEDAPETGRDGEPRPAR